MPIFPIGILMATIIISYCFFGLAVSECGCVLRGLGFDARVGSNVFFLLYKFITTQLVVWKLLKINCENVVPALHLSPVVSDSRSHRNTRVY